MSAKGVQRCGTKGAGVLQRCSAGAAGQLRVLAAMCKRHWSERGDLNSRPPVPQTGALTRLRYAPFPGVFCPGGGAGSTAVFYAPGTGPRSVRALISRACALRLWVGPKWGGGGATGRGQRLHRSAVSVLLPMRRARLVSPYPHKAIARRLQRAPGARCRPHDRRVTQRAAMRGARAGAAPADHDILLLNAERTRYHRHGAVRGTMRAANEAGFDVFRLGGERIASRIASNTRDAGEEIDCARQKLPTDTAYRGRDARRRT